MDTDITIRVAEPQDVEAVACIWMEGVLVSSGLSAPSKSDVISSFLTRICHPVGQSVLWVATRNDDIIGWQGLQDFGITQISRIAQSSTYISNSWQGRGIGRALLLHAQHQARDLGFDVIAGWIKTDNHASLSLIGSLNWKSVGILPRISDDDPELAYYAYAVPNKLG